MRYPDGAICCFHTKTPDYFELDHVTYEWAYSVYYSGLNKEEELPYDMLTPWGKPILTSTFKDANLMHDFTTGKSCTSIIHLFNQTPQSNGSPSAKGLLKQWCKVWNSLLFTVPPKNHGPQMHSSNDGHPSAGWKAYMFSGTTKVLSPAEPYHTLLWASIIIPWHTVSFVKQFLPM
jgi:hypothetical protein